MYHWPGDGSALPVRPELAQLFGRGDEDYIKEATARLTELLVDLSGKTFLDVGCGSGIHSLAAVTLALPASIPSIMIAKVWSAPRR